MNLDEPCTTNEFARYHRVHPDLVAGLGSEMVSTFFTQIFEILHQVDADVQAPAASGFGEIRGNRLRVNWIHLRGEDFFGIEIFDRNHSIVGLICLAPLVDETLVLGCRCTALFNGPCPPLGNGAGESIVVSVSVLHLIWEELIAKSIGEEFHPRSTPTFISLCAAATSCGGLGFIKDDAAQIADLSSDLNYWRGLAKAQAQAIRTMHVTRRADSVLHQEAGVSSSEESPREWRLSEIDEWAAIHADRIVVLPRALAAAKRSPFENHALVFHALDLLANVYPKVKAGVVDRYAFKSIADELGFGYGGSVDKSNAGERGDEYFIRWKGRRIFLDQHLSKGSARDPRFSLRIYYWWDEEEGKVVVGWLPSHLGTSRS